MKPTLVFLFAVWLCFCGCHGRKTVGEREMWLHGVWVLDSTQIGMAYIPSSCHELLPGSRFVFKADSTLDVFAKGSASKCNFMTLDYHLGREDLQVNEDDMLMHMDIVMLTADRLVLRSTYFDMNQNYVAYRDSAFIASGKGYDLYFRKVE